MAYTLEQILRQAVIDSVIPCMYCEYEPLEPDYDYCPECQKRNPLSDFI